MRWVLWLLPVVLAACIPTSGLETVNKTVTDTANLPAPQTQTNPNGEKLFIQLCSGCHQPNGLGIPGNFPPLAGHIPVVLAAKGGREYLPQLIGNGLRGGIQVLGQPYNGQMPSFLWLEDAQISDLLNYLSVAWDNAKLLPTDFKPYTPEEVKAARGKLGSSANMLEIRTKLGLP